MTHYQLVEECQPAAAVPSGLRCSVAEARSREIFLYQELEECDGLRASMNAELFISQETRLLTDF